MVHIGGPWTGPCGGSWTQSVGLVHGPGVSVFGSPFGEGPRVTAITRPNFQVWKCQTSDCGSALVFSSTKQKYGLVAGQARGRDGAPISYPVPSAF